MRLTPFISRALYAAVCGVFLFGNPIEAQQVADPFDPFSGGGSAFDEAEDEDAGKSVDQLLRESLSLQDSGQVLEGRSKLLKAIKKDPTDFRPYSLLSNYYLTHADHFRLALKYARQGARVFETKYGSPPYSDRFVRTWHGEILGTISQARLNLDDYRGALKELNTFERLGYTSSWLHSSKAWILMKLNRLDEAIKVAKEGTRVNLTPGNSLNILAILLSMTGQRQASLEVFEQALRYELARGESGHPATPLNNVGEVFKELFKEQMAKNSWKRALEMPDACEHVLPSLNLVIMQIDELSFKKATEVLDRFESCVAKYPLRNGEEHKGLVHLARARLAAHQGNLKSAEMHLGGALERTQWFGKIGTSPQDMQAAVFMTAAMIYEAEYNVLHTTLPESMFERLSLLRKKAVLHTKAWWYRRKARHLLVAHLNDFEDMYIRHTDSMLEYTSLGEVVETIPPATLARFLDQKLKDTRAKAQPYYRAYYAQSLHYHGDTAEALSAYGEALASLRDAPDALLKVHLLLKRLELLSPTSTRALQDKLLAFKLHPASLRHYGHRLPVQVAKSQELLNALGGSAFDGVSPQTTVPYTMSYNRKSANSSGDETHEVVLSSAKEAFPQGTNIFEIRGKADSLEGAINALASKVFSQGPSVSDQRKLGRK